MPLKRDKMFNILMPGAVVKNTYLYIHGSLGIRYNQAARHYVRKFFHFASLKLDFIRVTYAMFISTCFAFSWCL
jgi:hypothetical protein